ncbi:MAG: hypothetical protein LBI71_12980 [Enterobacteriaceae bacterium]|jgi:hypothetical protein|nr:hypothetical protein [Enterobacteriaceae bacterium]
MFEPKQGLLTFRAIIELRESWDNTSYKKCQLETIESCGTDAEIAEFNTGLSKNYTD